MNETTGRSRTLSCGLILVLFMLSGPAAAGTDDFIECELIEVDWEFRAWGQTEEGRACVLKPRAEYLRIEISTDTQSLTEMENQRGAGWTVSLAGGGDITLNRWRDEWQLLDGGLVAGVKVLAAAIVGGGPAVLAESRLDNSAVEDGVPVRKQKSWRAAPSRADRLASSLDVTLPPTAGPQASTLRGRMVRRGRGRGADRETLSFTWEGATSFTVSSSRRTGSLCVEQLSRKIVQLPVPEGFLPLWSLSTLYGTQ